MRVYTRKGDDGTTGLYFGGRVRKDSIRIQLNGAVDEAQAAIGMARVEFDAGSEPNELLAHIERDLYVLMAEVATAPKNDHKLIAGASLATEEMVEWLEQKIDALSHRFEMPSDFVIPGENRASATIDLARTVTRRAERTAVSMKMDGSTVARYLNRLSDLLWVFARWQEGHSQLANEKK